MINSVEDYELNYTLFLAEQEMFRGLTKVEYNIISESADIVAIEEGVKETVMNYLQKIITGIQNAWSKFKAKFTEKTAAAIAKAKPIIAASKNTFTVNNFEDYDLRKLDQYKVAPFDYSDSTKEKYSSVNEYIKATYPQLATKEESNLKNAMIEEVVIKQDKYTVDQSVCLDMIKFCDSEYKSEIDSISEDIKNLNNSSKGISELVNSIMSTPTTESLNILHDLIGLSIFNEAEGDDSEKMTFTDGDGSGVTSNGEGNGANPDKSKITTAVTIYMTSSSRLLSAKMSIVNKKFSTYNKIINHYSMLCAGDAVKSNIEAKKNKKELKKALSGGAPTVKV